MFENTQSESTVGIEKLKGIISTLKDEMAQQSEKYEETIGKCSKYLWRLDIQQHQLSLLKEKFMNDIKEITTKINMYFNQNENCKRSLSPKKEKKNLEKMLENYCNNMPQLAKVSICT